MRRAGGGLGCSLSLRLCAQSAKFSIELRRPVAAIGGLGVSALGEKGCIGARRRRLRRRAADRARRPRAVGVRSLRRRLPHRFPATPRHRRKPASGHARRAHRRPAAGRSRRSERAIRAWDGARAAPSKSRRSRTATTMTVTTKKIAGRTCDAKPRKAPQRDRQTGQGRRSALRRDSLGRFAPYATASKSVLYKLFRIRKPILKLDNGVITIFSRINNCDHLTRFQLHCCNTSIMRNHRYSPRFATSAIITDFDSTLARIMHQVQEKV